MGFLSSFSPIDGGAGSFGTTTMIEVEVINLGGSEANPSSIRDGNPREEKSITEKKLEKVGDMGIGVKAPHLESPNSLGILTIHRILAQDGCVVGDRSDYDYKRRSGVEKDESLVHRGLDVGEILDQCEECSIERTGQRYGEDTKCYSFSQSHTNTERYLNTETEDLMDVLEGKKFWIRKQDVRTPSPNQGTLLNHHPIRKIKGELRLFLRPRI